MSKKINTVKDNQKNIHDNVVNQLNQFQKLGEIITWHPGKGNVTHQLIQESLKKADLNEKVAKELAPRFAFSRACKKLAEDRVIDVLRDDSDTITFQFTKKRMDNEEWKYSKETLLNLNKTTGKIECEVKDLEKMAQDELDRCIKDRTTSDITKIVQNLFDTQADLFPIREQGGAYFVFEKDLDFVGKISMFLRELGGNIRRFPVPKGDQEGSNAVRETVEDGIAKMIEDHEEAVNSFSLNTRRDTMENAALRIKLTRLKLEAYSDVLAEHSENLKKKVEEINDKLLKEINRVTTTQQAIAKGEMEAPKRAELYGHSITAVLRWMGKEKWSFEDAKAAMLRKGIQLADATFRAQLLAGRKGERGEPANLTKEQEADLRGEAGKSKKKKVG